MHDEKSVLLSKGFWGAVAGVLLGLAALIGIDPTDIGLTDAELGEKLYGAAVFIAAALAGIGRIMAKKRVRVLP